MLTNQVEGLTEGNFYEFKVQAGNMAGGGGGGLHLGERDSTWWTLDKHSLGDY